MRGGASDRLYSSESLPPEEIFRLLKQQAKEELEIFSKEDPEMASEYSLYCSSLAGMEAIWHQFLEILPKEISEGLRSPEIEEVREAWARVHDQPALRGLWEQSRERFRSDQFGQFGQDLADSLETGQAHALAL